MSKQRPLPNHSLKPFVIERFEASKNPSISELVLAPAYYYGKDVKLDEYSNKIIRSKQEDLSEFFWPYINRTLNVVNLLATPSSRQRLADNLDSPGPYEQINAVFSGLGESPIALNYDLITIIPSHKPMEFSPTLEGLGKKLSEQFDVSFYKILSRSRPIKKQTECKSISERRANVSGSLETARNLHQEEKRILILDDVFTTGSSLSEARRVLFDAGAKVFTFLCLGINKMSKKGYGVSE